jgi:hypothetical protein
VDDLSYSLRLLCRRNRDGSHATQADRLSTLMLASHQLREAGFRQMQSSSLKAKHVDFLVTLWLAQDLAAGTIKNRLAHLRWWAEKIGKAGLISRDNAALSVPERRFVTTRARLGRSATVWSASPTPMCE